MQLQPGTICAVPFALGAATVKILDDRHAMHDSETVYHVEDVQTGHQDFIGETWLTPQQALDGNENIGEIRRSMPRPRWLGGGHARGRKRRAFGPVFANDGAQAPNTPVEEHHVGPDVRTTGTYPIASTSRKYVFMVLGRLPCQDQTQSHPRFIRAWSEQHAIEAFTALVFRDLAFTAQDMMARHGESIVIDWCERIRPEIIADAQEVLEGDFPSAQTIKRRT